MSSVGLSATQLRHPLASNKKVLEFKDDRERTFEEPFEVLSRYETEYAIAKGTYGFVARVRDREKAAEFIARQSDGYDEAEYDKATLVAIKKGARLFEYGIPRVWLCAIREIQLLFSFNHPNVMCATDLFVPLGEVKDMRPDLIRRRQADFEEVYLVMPFMNWSLRELLVDRDNVYLVHGNDPITRAEEVAEWHPLPSGLRKHLLYYMTCGLGYIHECGVMHRDLKPENILLTGDDASPMICDFGQGREIQRDQDVTVTKTDNCTQWYASPETLTFDHCGVEGESSIDHSTFHSADAWSLGCIAAEMLLGCPIFQTEKTGGEAQLKTIMAVLGPYSELECQSLGESRNETDNQHLRKVLETSARHESLLHVMCEAAYNRLGEEFDQDEFDLISGLLRYRPSERWTCQQVLESTFFVKDGYEPVIGGTRKQIKLVAKEDVDTPAKGRDYLWKMFEMCHPAVTQMMQVLQDQQ
jgi:serine/threonine protein kinase